MLTASQVVTVAYLTDYDLICPDCAIARYGALAVSLADDYRPSYTTDGELRPVSRYEAGSEPFVDYDDETDDYHGPYCGRCTEEIDP